MLFQTVFFLLMLKFCHQWKSPWKLLFHYSFPFISASRKRFCTLLLYILYGKSRFFQFSSVLWWGWLSNRKNIPCENIYGSLIPKCVFMANQDQPHVTAEDKAGQTMSMGVCYVCVLLNGANVFELRFSLRTSFYLLYLFGRWTAVIGNFRRWTIFWTYVICIHVFTEIN